MNLGVGVRSFRVSLEFIKPRSWLFWLSLVLMVANLSFDIGLAVVQQFFFNDMTSGNLVDLYQLLTTTTVVSLTVVAAMTVQYYSQQTASACGSQRFLQDLCQTLFNANYETVTAMHSADVVSRVTIDANQMIASVPLVINGLGYQVVVTMVAFTLLWQIRPAPAILALASGPAIFCIGRIFDRRIQHDSESIERLQAQARALLQDALQHPRFVRVYGLEDHYLQQVGDLGLQQTRQSVHRAVGASATRELSEFTQSLATLVSAFMVAGGVLIGHISAGAVMTFLFLMGQIQLPFVNLSTTWTALQQSLGSGRRVFGMLDQLSNRTPPAQAEVGADSSPSTLGVPPMGRNLAEQSRRRSAIRLHQVTWRPKFWVDSTPLNRSDLHPVFDGVDLNVPLFQFLAIIGPSGEGKTSLARLIAGLYRPDHGWVEILGQDVSGTPFSASNSIAYLPQTPFVFAGTITQNLLMANRYPSDQAFRDAIVWSGCDEFIPTLPQQYDTRVGDGGLALSGGQRQRLALARVFLADRPILILDEPASALDLGGVERLGDALAHLRKRSTLLVISHQKTLVRHADRIVELRNGHLLEP